MRERRREARVEMELEVDLVLAGDPPVPAQTKNLSAHGALVSVEVRAWRTGPVTLTFKEPEVLAGHTVSGRVTRVQGMRNTEEGNARLSIGVQFVDVAEELSAELKKLLYH